MVANTIKNTGKRRGGKKSNRKTYKQRGGNKMFIMFILMLISLGLMVPVSAKFFNEVVDKKANEMKLNILNTNLNKYGADLKTTGLLPSTGKLAIASLTPFGQGVLVGDAIKTYSERAQITNAIGSTNKEIAKLEAQIDENILYIPAEIFSSFFPAGFTKDFGPSADYEPNTTRVNTEAPSVFNLFSPKTVRAPMYPTQFGDDTYFALNMEKYLELVKSNIAFAKIAGRLTKAIENQ